MKRQSLAGGLALLRASGLAGGGHKTSRQGRLKEVWRAAAAAGVLGARRSAGRGRELCPLQGKVGRNVTRWCLERLEGAVSPLAVRAESRAPLLFLWVTLLFPHDLGCSSFPHAHHHILPYCFSPEPLGCPGTVPWVIPRDIYL